MDDQVRRSMLTNIGNLVAFRSEADDVELLRHYFQNLINEFPWRHRVDTFDTSKCEQSSITRHYVVRRSRNCALNHPIVGGVFGQPLRSWRFSRNEMGERLQACNGHGYRSFTAMTRNEFSNSRVAQRPLKFRPELGRYHERTRAASSRFDDQSRDTVRIDNTAHQDIGVRNNAHTLPVCLAASCVLHGFVD